MFKISTLIFLNTSILLSLPAVGWVEIAGYTTIDRQIYGPSLLRIYNDTLFGIHITWKDEPSRALYNFKPRQSSSFRWSNGINVFAERVNFGNLYVSPRNRCAYLVGNYFDNNQYVPVYAEDSAPGQGNFRQYVQIPNYKWSVMIVSNYGDLRFVCQKEDTLYYRSQYFEERRFGFFGQFPTHNITASRDTSRIAIIWTATIPSREGVMFVRESRNNGYFWLDTVAVSRNIPSELNNTFLGGHCIYDFNRKVHIVANTYDGNNLYRVELWHCLKDSPPIWSRIGTVATEHRVPVGDYALYAGRPSIGQNLKNGDLFVCWEQFDAENFEPLTGLARAEIWASRSTDNGFTWGEPIRLTVPDNTSKRFPSLAPIVNDTLHITYMIDSIAGFWELGQGPKTTNPIIYHRVLANSVPVGIELEVYPSPALGSFSVYPNPFTKKIIFRIPNLKSQQSILRIYDLTGKLVFNHFIPITEKSFVWEGLDNSNMKVKPGVYFCELINGEKRAIKQLLFLR